MMRIQIPQRVPLLLAIALALVFALKITQVWLMSAYGIRTFEKISAASHDEPRFKVLETLSETLAPPPGYKLNTDYWGLAPYEAFSAGIMSRVDDTVTWMILAGILVASMVSLSCSTGLKSYPYLSNERSTLICTTPVLRVIMLYGFICITVSVAYILEQQTQAVKALAGTFFVDTNHLPIKLIQWSEGILNLLIIWIGYSPILVSIPLSDQYIHLFEEGHCDRSLCWAASLLVNSGIIPVISTTVVYVTLLLALRGKELEYGRGFRFTLSYSPMTMITWLLLYSGGHFAVTLRFIVRFLRCDRRKVSLGAAGLPFKLLWLEFRPADDRNRKLDR